MDLVLTSLMSVIPEGEADGFCDDRQAVPVLC
jgi:hypothetical protein